ncbi:cyclin-like protein [Xylariaceae sp. FL0662B]|nr:cyclin-like protein [Xylariaceae sp. FL0662B]
MAPNQAAKNGTIEGRQALPGPHVGSIKVGHQYDFEARIRRKLANMNSDSAWEDNYRLLGIQLIQDVRQALQLPVKTYDTACTFYHRFRLKHPGAEYNYNDAALACLFVACKVEDTLKKSREILCANHNIKNSDHPTTQDDKIFDQSSKMIIGLERYIVEAINFDFRVRNTQKVLAKIVKQILPNRDEAKHFFPIAFRMSIDMYKTFGPLKHTSSTCALAIAQLTAMVTGKHVRRFLDQNPLDWHSDEQAVAEITLDLLDLYTQHNKATKVGPMFDLQVFIDIQIQVNESIVQRGIPRYLNQCRDCEATMTPLTPSTDSPISPSTPGTNSTIKRGPKGPEGTTRFLFDADEADREKETFHRYTKDEWEEYEEEVEEPISDMRDGRRPEPRGPKGPRGHGHGHGRGHGRGGFDPGWHPRNRHDRRRRGGNFY